MVNFKQQAFRFIAPIFLSLIIILLVLTYYFVVLDVIPTYNLTHNSNPEITKIANTLQEKFQFNEPILKRYLKFIGNSISFNFGPSYYYMNRSVIDLIYPPIIPSLIVPLSLVGILILFLLFIPIPRFSPPIFYLLIIACEALMLYWILFSKPTAIYIPILLISVMSSFVLVMNYKTTKSSMLLFSLFFITLISQLIKSELIIGINGLSKILIFSVRNRDYPLIVGTNFIILLLSIALSLFLVYLTMVKGMKKNIDNKQRT